jgi:flagellar basal-body rod modification protein FlgD
MAVNATAAVTDAPSGAAAMKKATGMNKDDFLKLFIAQMQNQDPLNPMDSTQFLGQLAQLTQVEQAYNTNSNLASLIAAQNNSNNLSAVSFLGAMVTANSDQVNLSGGQANISYNLAARADKVLVQISDAAGNLVQTINVANAASGNNSVSWDGKGSNGADLVPGVYTVAVTATGADGTQFSGTPMIQGKVDGLSLDATTPTLSVGGINIPLSSVLQVKGV